MFHPHEASHDRAWAVLFFSAAAFTAPGNIPLMIKRHILIESETYHLSKLFDERSHVFGIFGQHNKTAIAAPLGKGGAHSEFDMWEWLKLFFFLTNSKHCFLPLSAPVPGTGAKVFPVRLKMEWINTEEDESPFLNSKNQTPPPQKNNRKP